MDKNRVSLVDWTYFSHAVRNVGLWLFFPAFSSVVRQMPGYNSQRLGHDQNSSKFICVFLVILVVLLLIVMFVVLFMCKCVLPPGVNPTAVDKYININILGG
jgi:uncharacterized membrane-anchored protein